MHKNRDVYLILPKMQQKWDDRVIIDYHCSLRNKSNIKIYLAIMWRHRRRHKPKKKEIWGVQHSGKRKKEKRYNTAAKKKKEKVQHSGQRKKEKRTTRRRAISIFHYSTPDIIFVKFFTPAQFQDFENYPKNARKSRHFKP